MDNGPAVAWIKDDEGRFLYVNRPFELRFGRPATEFLGKTDADLWPAEVAQSLRDNDRTVLQSGRLHQLVETVPTPDGRTSSWMVFKFPITNGSRPICVGGMAIDITERRKSEQRSQAHERVARVLAAVHPMLSALDLIMQAMCETLEFQLAEIWTIDRKDGVLRLATSWHEPSIDAVGFVESSNRVAFPPDVGLVGKIWSTSRPIWIDDLSSDHNFVRLKSALQFGFRTACGLPILLGETVLGVMTFFSTRSRTSDEELIRALSGHATQVGLLLEHQRVLDDLAENEARMRAIVETAVDAIITIDAKGIIQTFNPAAEGLFGYPSREAVGQNVKFLMPLPHRDQHDDYIARYLHTGKKNIIGSGREVIACRKDGVTFPIHIGVSETWVGNRRLFTAIIRDLSGLKRMQEALVRSQSLAALGEMSSAVAHEIRNPIAAISGALQYLRKELPGEDPLVEVSDEILVQVSRLDSIVRDLVLFAESWSAHPSRCNVRELSERVCGIVGEDKTFARIRILLEGGERTIAPIDSVLYEQLLRNLLLNAAHAMPEGGEIRVSISETPALAVVVLADTGKGISPEVQANLFRPFVTTKARGTGLGLPICRRIMDAHRGSIEIQSDRGKGTRVELRFPKETISG